MSLKMLAKQMLLGCVAYADHLEQKTWPFPARARVVHHKHGAGVVKELQQDGRTRVAFDSGEEHQYKSSSMYEMRAEEASSTASVEASNRQKTAADQLQLYIPGEVSQPRLTFTNPVVMYTSPDNPGALEAAQLVQSSIPALRITTLAPEPVRSALSAKARPATDQEEATVFCIRKALHCGAPSATASPRDIVTEGVTTKTGIH